MDRRERDLSIDMRINLIRRVSWQIWPSEVSLPFGPVSPGSDSIPRPWGPKPSSESLGHEALDEKEDSWVPLIVTHDVIGLTLSEVRHEYTRMRPSCCIVRGGALRWKLGGS